MNAPAEATPSPPAEPPARSSRAVVSMLVPYVVAVVACGVIHAWAGRFHAWNSDDVAWHVALRTWRPFSETLLLPENTYVLHVPVFALGELLLPSTTWALFVQAAVLDAVAVVLMLRFVRFALGRLPSAAARPRWFVDVVGVLAVVWVWAVSDVLAQLAVRPTNRNLELGAALLAIQAGIEMSERTSVSWPRVVVSAVLLGLIALDDPLLAYTLVAPAVVVLAVVVVAGWRTPASTARWRPVLAAAAGGLVVWRLLVLVGDVLAIEVIGLGARVARPSEVPDQLGVAADAITDLLGIRTDDVALVSWGFLGDALVVVTVVACAVAWVWSVLRVDRRWLPVVVAGAWALALLGAFVLSSHGATILNTRYLSVGLAALPVLLAVAIVELRHRLASAALTGVVAVLVMVGVGSAAIDLAQGPDVSPNRKTAALVAAAERVAASGPIVGYADYWDAHIVGYLTDGDPEVLALGCAAGVSVPRRWISDVGRFDDVAGRDVRRSFLVVDPDPGLFTCPPDQLLAQFGEPDSVEPVDGAIELWVYSRNIGRELGAASD